MTNTPITPEQAAPLKGRYVPVRTSAKRWGVIRLRGTVDKEGVLLSELIDRGMREEHARAFCDQLNAEDDNA